VEALLRQLTLGGIPAHVVLAASALAFLGALVAIALGTRAFRRRGSPPRAIVAAIVLSLPLALIPAFGFEAARFAPAPEVAADPASAVAVLRADLAVRRVTGFSGLVLALPLGAAAGLWAGIAASRRTRRAAERARLAALAAGEAETGRAVAAAVGRSRLPEIGGAIGVLAGLSVAGLPSVGLLLSTTALEAALADLVHLDPVAAPVFLQVAAAGASRPLLAAALAGALGTAVAGLLLGTAIHAASSRRRNLAVARRILADRQADPALRATVTSALEATGKPGPVAPALIALALLLLAALALARAASLGEAGRPAEEGLAIRAGR
jgi:hypothetical protein